jgi:hypothetical protein
MTSKFEHLREHILKLSAAPRWHTAVLEWDLAEVYHATDAQECPCTHFPIIEICM